MSRPPAVAEGLLARFTEVLPAGTALGPAPALAITADGGHLAYIGVVDGISRLYVRALGEKAARPLPGTERADQPFFSPDGRWLGFFADDKLKKISITGAAPVTLADAPNPRGGTWIADDTIVFAPSPASVLVRLPAAGGAAQPVSALDRTLNEASHRWPHVLPDGETLLFAAGPTVSARGWNEAHVVRQSLKTGVRHIVAPNGTFPQFAASGHLVYVQDSAVYAQPFDPATSTSRDAVPLLDRIETLGGINGGAYQLAVSASGTMLAVPAGPRELVSPVWVDRAGHEVPLDIPSSSYVDLRLSPNGSRLAVTVTTATGSDIWVRDLARGTVQRLTSDERALWPLWSPDGLHIAYASSREGSTNIYVKRSDGSGAEERWTSTAYTYIPHSWPVRGSEIAVAHVDPRTRLAIRLLPVGGKNEPRQLDSLGGATQPAVSPDGRWMAYTSSVSGVSQVYVQPLSGVHAPVQVSTTGGNEPVWARSSRELFFRQGDAVLAADIHADTNDVRVGTATVLFRGEYVAGGVRAGFGVDVGDRRLLFIKRSGRVPDRTRFDVALNWSRELAARLAASVP